MANRPAPALVLREGDRAELESWLRSRSVPAGLAKRARMVLLAADGVGNREIAQRVGASPTTVIQWRARYDERGLGGLGDRERSGRPRELDHRKIVAETLKPPPKSLEVTHLTRATGWFAGLGGALTCGFAVCGGRIGLLTRVVG